MSLLHFWIPKLSYITYVPVSGKSNMVIEFPPIIDLAAGEFILFSILIFILALPFLFESKPKKENV